MVTPPHLLDQGTESKIRTAFRKLWDAQPQLKRCIGPGVAVYWAAMKTNTIAQHPVPSQSPLGTLAFTRFAGLGKLLLAVVCASLVSFATMPSVFAAGADGDYKLVSASGSLTANGETMELPEDILQEFGALENAKITIENNRLQLNRKAALKIIKKLGDEFGLEFETTITGPKYLQLKKSGKRFVGNTSNPIVVTFETVYQGEKIAGNLKTDFNAVVKGKTLTMKVPVTGKVLGIKFSGDIEIVCKR